MAVVDEVVEGYDGGIAVVTGVVGVGKDVGDDVNIGLTVTEGATFIEGIDIEGFNVNVGVAVGKDVTGIGVEVGDGFNFGVLVSEGESVVAGNDVDGVDVGVVVETSVNVEWGHRSGGVCVGVGVTESVIRAVVGKGVIVDEGAIVGGIAVGDAVRMDMAGIVRKVLDGIDVGVAVGSTVDAT